MDVDELLILLHKNYDKLLKICYYFSLSKYDSDDVIQNFYVSVKVKGRTDIFYVDGELNMPYIFICLRNAIFNDKKKAKSAQFVEMVDIPDLINEEDEYKIETYNKILEEINKIRNWFDAKLAYIFYEEGHTINSLSKATGIKGSTIYYHLEKANKIIRKKYL